MVVFVLIVLALGVVGARAWWLNKVTRHVVSMLGGTYVTGNRALGPGGAYVLDVVSAGWRIEVDRMRLGERMTMTVVGQRSFHLTARRGFTEAGTVQRRPTGFAEIDRFFTVTSTWDDLMAAVFAHSEVRRALLELRALTRVIRVDVTAGGSFVALVGFPRAGRGKRIVEAVVAVARALDEASQVEIKPSSGLSIEGGVSGGSGLPVAMRLGR